MKLTLLLLSVFASWAAPPRLIFIKSFPGSSPAFVRISVDRAGTLLYQEMEHEPNPLQARIEDRDVEPLFALSGELQNFRTPIESGLKVANTGAKTFRYESEDGQASETHFNYSTILAAQQLLGRFEQISASERAFLELDRTIHFDKLGVNDALAQVESLWLKHELAAPSQFVPLLTRISAHTAFMHLVRDRAAHLKDEFTAEAALAPAKEH